MKTSKSFSVKGKTSMELIAWLVIGAVIAGLTFALSGVAVHASL